MVSIKIKDFDLGKIAESGQCFRMNYIGKGTYSIVAFGKYIEISQYQDTVILSCDEEEYQLIWRDYFDIDTDYEAIRNNAKADDFLNAAMNYSSGIRILKQDLWEMIITFIISQRKSINNIKDCVQRLCINYGEHLFDGENGYFTFPTPEVLSKVSVEDLRACGLGYRDEYVHNAAQWCLSNMTFDTNSNRYIMTEYPDIVNSYTYAKSVLTQITGVGDKIANCICLFALHQLEACPIDTHMQQIIDKIYNGIMPEWMVNDKAGVLQQYAFYYKRLFHMGRSVFYGKRKTV